MQLSLIASGTKYRSRQIYFPEAIWLPSEENFVFTLPLKTGITSRFNTTQRNLFPRNCPLC
jgi:hypothetical protein